MGKPMTAHEQKRVLAMTDSDRAKLGISDLECLQNRELTQFLDLMEMKRRNKDTTHG